MLQSRVLGLLRDLHLCGKGAPSFAALFHQAAVDTAPALLAQRRTVGTNLERGPERSDVNMHMGSLGIAQTQLLRRLQTRPTKNIATYMATRTQTVGLYLSMSSSSSPRHKGRVKPPGR